jgi:hypothetical protein
MLHKLSRKQANPFYERAFRFRLYNLDPLHSTAGRFALENKKPHKPSDSSSLTARGPLKHSVGYDPHGCAASGGGEHPHPPTRRIASGGIQTTLHLRTYRHVLHILPSVSLRTGPVCRPPS